MGQTNEQQRHFSKWLISEFHGEVDSIPKSLKHVLPPTDDGILSLPFSSEIKDELLAKTT
jgi:hypothetical protein